LKQLKDKGAHFRSLTEAIETESPHGRMVMQMLGVFAEFERAIIKERTKVGLARARAAGRVGGPKFKLSPEQQKAAVEESLSLFATLIGSLTRSISSWVRANVSAPAAKITAKAHQI
jgi:DNA invertase Pin-like site-specific DNA recombinase